MFRGEGKFEPSPLPAFGWLLWKSTYYCSKSAPLGTDRSLESPNGKVCSTFLRDQVLRDLMRMKYRVEPGKYTPQAL